MEQDPEGYHKAQAMGNEIESISLIKYPDLIPSKWFHYTITWDGTDEDNKPLPSGLYIYRLSTEKFVETRKMLLLK